MVVRTRIHTGDLVPPIQALEGYLQTGGVTILQAAFEHSFFVDPVRVRSKTPCFPDRARSSREFYPNKRKGERADWNGHQVVLDDNAYAQRAWRRYTGRAIYRGSGYGVRHIWGHPWNPDAFTAGWNLCYMPFWAGMLTEKQHPHPELQPAVQQASWDLFFRDDPVCAPPDFVKDPGMDLASILGNQPLLILQSKTSVNPSPTLQLRAPGTDAFEQVKEIRRKSNRSWVNLCTALRSLQGKAHRPFTTRPVQSSSKSTVRRILRETGLSPAQLEALLKKHGKWK